MTMKIHPASWSPKIPAGHVNTNSDTTAIAIIGAGVGGISASTPNRTTAWAAEPLVEDARPGSARPRVTPTTAHLARTGIEHVGGPRRRRPDGEGVGVAEARPAGPPRSPQAGGLRTHRRKLGGRGAGIERRAPAGVSAAGTGRSSVARRRGRRHARPAPVGEGVLCRSAVGGGSNPNAVPTRSDRTGAVPPRRLMPAWSREHSRRVAPAAVETRAAQSACGPGVAGQPGTRAGDALARRRGGRRYRGAAFLDRRHRPVLRREPAARGTGRARGTYRRLAGRVGGLSQYASRRGEAARRRRRANHHELHRHAAAGRPVEAGPGLPLDLAVFDWIDAELVDDVLGSSAARLRVVSSSSLHGLLPTKRRTSGRSPAAFPSIAWNARPNEPAPSRSLARSRTQGPSALDVAMDFLRKLLSDGAVPVGDVRKRRLQRVSRCRP